MLRFSQFYGIDLSEALETRMEENREKHPVEEAEGPDRKYTELGG